MGEVYPALVPLPVYHFLEKASFLLLFALPSWLGSLATPSNVCALERESAEGESVTKSSSVGQGVPCHCLTLMFGREWKGREDKVGKEKFVEHFIPFPICVVLLFSRPLR